MSEKYTVGKNKPNAHHSSREDGASEAASGRGASHILS